MSLKMISLIAALVWFSCPVVINTQAQEPAPNRNSGSISGRITVDGKPKAGLVVELLATETNGSRRPIAKTITSKTGKYVLPNVASGTYDVSPSTPTLVVPNEGSSGQSGRSVTIETGESVKGIDFDLLSKATIRGRVLDVSGVPVRGQTVELILRGEDNYSRSFYSSASGDHQTNDEGVYRISGVPPGRYIVKVGTAYGLTATGRSEKGRVYYPETFHPSADEASKATVIEVAAGREITDVDITVSRPLKLYEIVGQLVTVETGAPVANVELEIITAGASGSSHLSGAFRSDATGEFRISNAMPGHYVIAPENDRASNTYGEPISFDVKDEDVTGLKIPMRSASTLTGIVTIEGSVDVPIAEVLSRMTIDVYTFSLKNMMGSTVSGSVNADGGFRISGIRPGKMSLSSSIKPGGPATALRILRIERNGIEMRDDVEVRSGEDMSGLRVVLGAGSSVLRGDLKIEGGPLEGVNLHVLYRPTNGDPNSFSSADLDARQHFVIKGLTPGEYELNDWTNECRDLR